MGDEVFCLSETKNCERLEAHGVEGPEQNSQTLPQESSVVCGCGLMSAKENTETNQTEFLRVVLGPGQVLFLVCCPVLLFLPTSSKSIPQNKNSGWLTVGGSGLCGLLVVVSYSLVLFLGCYLCCCWSDFLVLLLFFGCCVCFCVPWIGWKSQRANFFHQVLFCQYFSSPAGLTWQLEEFSVWCVAWQLEEFSVWCVELEPTSTSETQ